MKSNILAILFFVTPLVGLVDNTVGQNWSVQNLPQNRVPQDMNSGTMVPSAQNPIPFGVDPATWGPPISNQPLPVGTDPATWGPPISKQHVPDRTRTIRDRFGRTINQRLTRVWVAANWNEFGQWVPGHWKSVWTETSSVPADDSKITTNKSVNLSSTAVNVNFKNESSVDLDLIWVDFSGNEQPYGTLSAGDSKVMQTGHGHVWRFKRNGQVLNSYQATQDTEQTFTIGSRPDSERNPQFIFTKPNWVTSGTIPGFSVSKEPNPAPASSSFVAGLLSNQNNRNLQLVKVHYLGQQVVAPNHTPPQQLVVETRDVATGATSFWDVKLNPSQGSWNLTSAYQLPMVSGRPPSIRNYRRPNWVVQKAAPGGVSPADPNSPKMKQIANQAISIINSSGQRSVELDRILHAGTQALYPSPKTYLVVQLKDQRYWEITFFASGSGSPKITWTPLS